MKRFDITFIGLIIALVAAFALPGRVRAAEDEEFFRRMINTDIVTLKNHADRLIVPKPDSAISYLSAVAARYSPDMPRDEKEICAKAMNNLGYLHFYHNNDPVVAYSYLVRGMSAA